MALSGFGGGGGGGGGGVGGTLHAYLNQDITISGNRREIVNPMSSEINTIAGTFDDSAGTLTVDNAGVYLIFGAVTWQFPVDNGRIDGQIRKNGINGDLIFNMRQVGADDPDQANYYWIFGGGVRQLSADDTVNLQAQEISGNSQEVAGSSDSTYLNITRLK